MKNIYYLLQRFSLSQIAALAEREAGKKPFTPRPQAGKKPFTSRPQAGKKPFTEGSQTGSSKEVVRKQ